MKTQFRVKCPSCNSVGSPGTRQECRDYVRGVKRGSLYNYCPKGTLPIVIRELVAEVK